jgi:hypothetical protein
LERGERGARTATSREGATLNISGGIDLGSFLDF